MDQEYADGRVTVMTDEELLTEISAVEKKLGISLTDTAEQKKKVINK